MKYNPQSTEKEIQARWRDAGAFTFDPQSKKPGFYVLAEFPYPSGVGLHIGHARPYTGMDVLARTRRMQGYNVLFPIGWDAFGLPAENYAIKNHMHPRDVVARNVTRFRTQIQNLGYSFDLTREINTTDPNYYKWTQWIFLKLFEKGLAYKSPMNVNWCPSCKCVLANEEVIGGECERCGSTVTRKEKSQWTLKITAYAQRLLDDLDTVDFPARVAAQQRNWIGRSEGAEVVFAVRGKTVDDQLTVYTTRPDTLFGATYMVISPEHPALERWKDSLLNNDEIAAYQTKTAQKSEFERTELAKDKTGVRLDGVTAINPVNNTEIPIFISDYVLMSYGTGAIMAVPAHDERDWDFAQKFRLPIIEVVAGGDVEKAAFVSTEYGTLVNSGFLNGYDVSDAKRKIIDWLAEQGKGTPKINFKLRDWIFARQRYWGEPIPVVHCPKCGIISLPEDALPLHLPEVESYKPTETGESPLALLRDWVQTTCPKCGGAAERETDTMPQWAGSSWYFLRYMQPDNPNAIADADILKAWSPVDWYNGGMEHTTLHLLYSRFWHKFLFDVGVVPTPEPYKKRTSHGFIQGSDGQKVSKSAGNGVDPDEVVEKHGADTMRISILFLGDFEKGCRWSDNTVTGARRFLERVWSVAEKTSGNTDAAISARLETLVHQTIQKVTDDINALKFNTAIAALMSLLGEMEKGCTRGELEIFTRLLSPFAPHIAEDIWALLGNKTLCCQADFPQYDPAKTLTEEVEMAVQVGGKLRGTVFVLRDSDEETVFAAATNHPKLAPLLQGKTIVKRILVPNRLLNVIVKGGIPHA